MFGDRSRGFQHNCMDSQVFVFEVVGLHAGADVTDRNARVRRSDRVAFSVPYARMSRELRRVALQGGTIVDIYPLNSPQAYDESAGEPLDWWIQVSMQSPSSVMYFGPFDTHKEAESKLAGYVEDLLQEGATDMVVDIQRCHPETLTASDVA